MTKEVARALGSMSEKLNESACRVDNLYRSLHNTNADGIGENNSSILDAADVIDENCSAITDLADYISELETSITTMQADIADLQERVKKLEER
jgi:methyl-accepting chemotaxis protein